MASSLIFTGHKSRTVLGSNRAVRRVKAGIVVVKDEIRERNRHRDLDSVNVVQAADREKKDLTGVEDQFVELGLVTGRPRL